VCNLSREAFVVHKEEVNFLDVADKELLEAAGEKVTGLKMKKKYKPLHLATKVPLYLLVAPVTDLGHGNLSLEPTPHSVVNTLWFPPCLLNTVVTIGLVAPVFERK
jgi:hypothetical protein